jgi:hypothetical protein
MTEEDQQAIIDLVCEKSSRWSREEITEAVRKYPEAWVLVIALWRLGSQSRKVCHDSDCAVHNAPALPVGPCDCGVIK